MNAPMVSSSDRSATSDAPEVSLHRPDPPLPSVPIVVDGVPATVPVLGDDMLLTTQLSSGSISVRSQAPGGARRGTRRALMGMIAVGGLMTVVALVTVKFEQRPGADEVAPAAPNPIARAAPSLAVSGSACDPSVPSDRV